MVRLADPVSPLVERYRQHIRGRHLDVGPGTGYFIDRSGLPAGNSVTLLDPNENVLAYAARRLRRYDLTTVQADVLKPLPVDGQFESAALSLVIHCLPGPRARKAQAIANVTAVLAPTGRALRGDGPRAGRTPDEAVADGVARLQPPWSLRQPRRLEEGLRDMLLASFERVELEVIGSVALFSATEPHGTAKVER